MTEMWAVSCCRVRCESVTPQTGAAHHPEPQTAGERSNVVFPTESESEYYVALYYCCGNTGDFAVRFAILSQGDICSDVVDLGMLTVEPTFILPGSTDGAKQYLNPDGNCTTGANFESPTAVYSFEGDGSIYNLQSSDNIGFSSTLSIYEGDCQGLFCVEKVGDWQDNAFVSDLGTKYFVFVSSREGRADSGDFTIQIRRIDKGNMCTNAVDLGEVKNYTAISGSTRSGQFFGQGPCQNWARSRGALYSVIGNGAAYTVSLCEWSNARFLSIFKGPCTDPQCVGAHECKYTWLTEPGETYFVLIQSEYGSIIQADNYVLALSSTDRGNFCRDSISISGLSSSVIEMQGSTENGKIYPQPSDCYSIEFPAAAYRIEGGDDFITVWISSNVPDPRFRLAIYSEGPECSNDVACLDVVRSCDKYTWKSEPGHAYVVLVGAEDPVQQKTGNFVLSARKWYKGTLCDNSTELGDVPAGEMIVTGSTERDGLLLDLPGCYFANVGDFPAVTYIFRGTGSTVTARVQSLTTRHSAVIFAYEGPCGSPTCVDNDRYSNSQSLTWSAAVGVEYYIVVSGCSDPTGMGEFELHLTSTLAGDCRDAMPLGPIPQEGLVVENSFEEAVHFSNLTRCHPYDDQVPSPGLLYSFTGSGSTVLVSTVTQNYYDTPRMIIYRGSCEALECVYDRHDLQSAVIDATEGTTFFVYVTDTSRASTTFSLKFDVRETVDICTDSENLGVIYSERQFAIARSTKGSKFVHSVDSCRHDGIWSPVQVYQVQGSGDLVGINAFSINFNPLVSVLQGSDCESPLVCVESIHSGWFLAEAGTTYFLIVHGELEQNEQFGSEGDFVLRARSIPSGDLCSEAIPLEYPSVGGFSVSGSTSLGHFFDISDCTYDGSHSRAVVYEVMGTGEHWTAYLSFRESGTFDVLTGNCSSFECVNTQHLDGGAGKSWKTELGIIYYLVIHNGNNPNGSGDFHVSFDRIGSGDPCIDAIEMNEVPPEGLVVLGSTSDDGRLFSMATCVEPVESTRSMVYSVRGTGHMYRASVHGLNFGDARLSVYNNTCENATCVETAYYDNSLEWYAESTVSYYIAVHGCCDLSSRGDFVLQLDTSAAPEAPETDPPTTEPPTTESPIIPRTPSPTETLSPSPEPTEPSGALPASRQVIAVLLVAFCVYL